MLALSRILAAVVSMSDPVPDLKTLESKEYRFAVEGVPSIRLPKDTSALDEALSAEGEDRDLCVLALSAPTSRVPLVSVGDNRRAALLAAIAIRGEVVLVSVTVTVRVGTKKYMPTDIVSVEYAIARSEDEMLDQLESLWDSADPGARKATATAKAMWLGGSHPALSHGDMAAIRARGGVFGLDVEVVTDVARHVREVSSRVGDGPPEVMIVWRPAAHGSEPAVATYRDATADGELIELDEPTLGDAMIELRMICVERGMLDVSVPEELGAPPPSDGEERFYIKHHGSGVGDVMIEVPECEHNKWGSDQSRKAPRALKGIAAGTGARPKALFLCAKCTKHRWRARF